MFDLRHSAAFGKSGKVKNIQNEKIRYGANIIFCFFSTQKIFHLGGFHDRGEGG